MIRFDRVCKTYGRKQAVTDLTLEVSKGTIFAFLGPNGAGKTTTIKMATGLVRPTSGRIEVEGFDIQRRPIEARRVLGYVPDQPFLYDKLTGREFLRFMGRLYGLPDATIAAESGLWIGLFDMEEWIDELAETYSHGMKQRVVLAATFLHHPRTVLLDEPMVGLDPASIRLVEGILRKEARKGTTIFLSTHVLSFAEDLADRVAIIHEGTLRAVGSVLELKERFEKAGRLEDVFFRITEWNGRT